MRSLAPQKEGPLSNEDIQSADVQVIGAEGENQGVMRTRDAIAMAQKQERPDSAMRLARGMREAGSAVQFFAATLGMLLIGVVIAVAMKLSIPGNGHGDDAYKRPDPHWCNGCVLAAPIHSEFRTSG